MLLSADGIGCYGCKSRLILPRKTRAVAWAVFLGAMLPLFLGAPGWLGGIVIGLTTIITAPLVHRAELQAVPMETPGTQDTSVPMHTSTAAAERPSR